MPLVGGWVVPHAPVLVPGVGRRAARARRPDMPDLAGAEVVVVASPHGRNRGVYRGASGSLAGFGLPWLERRASAASPAARALARAWRTQLLDGPPDHGALVPLWWLDGAAPLVLCAFGDPRGRAPADLAAEAGRLAEGVDRLGREAAVAFVASAHLSAGMGPGAPLGALPRAAHFDARVLEALREPGRLLDIPADEWERAGSCGLAPLTALGLLFDRGRGEVVHYEHPFGVGYVHARIEP